MDWNDTLGGLVTALGLGLLIGVVRERRHPARPGVRSHALAAVLGYVCWRLGPAPFVVALLTTGVFALVSYIRADAEDRGIAGELALVLTLVLAALAHQSPPLAAALGVLTAILLYAKQGLRWFSRELISEQEMRDALMLAAAALVVAPLLPGEAIDPWGVLNPTTLWRIVVLMMAVGMLGHVARRAVGARAGLPVAGFFSGFASSTATVASLGRLAREKPALTGLAAAAALLANLASLLLLAAVIGAASPALLDALIWPLVAAGTGLVAVALLLLRRDPQHQDLGDASAARAFQLVHALSLAAAIAAVSLLSAWLGELFGRAGVLVAAICVALVELQAAAVSVAQLGVAGGIPAETAQWGIVGVLAASAAAKGVLAFFAGGRRFGALVAAGLAAMGAGAALLMMA
ncbi:MgtC/SapB family protein [Noviherbaspirillum aridicola]|uniref:DUF4010 domain-containing protein n=1 Tax=Noviherbaspirillum aridicola TaxID=2849687 RepID=A0ABQ4Q7T2_9BURK|nr:DUF4010 domain-containing protein [Noviherbaspirillum aridicola]GIZ53281.1 hypothetical protein NCCP691_32950 [Noviherbaspirillum aridicola]